MLRRTLRKSSTNKIERIPNKLNKVGSQRNCIQRKKPIKEIRPSRIFLSSFPILNRIPIYDDSPAPALDDETPYQLFFTTGKVTLKVFKQLYLKNQDAYICVKNYEQFLYEFRQFRHLEFIMLSEDERKAKNQRLKMQKTLTQRIEEAKRRYAICEARIRNGRTKTKAIDKDANTDAMPGVRISFAPCIIDSIRTSLLNPSVYLSAELPCHRIIKELMTAPVGLVALQSCIEDVDIEPALKSLLLAGIVKQKNGIFYINDLFKA